MSQNSDILRHLKAGNSITQLDALNLFGCFRLAARVHVLRSEGHWIETINITKGNKTFAQYRLIKTNSTKTVASV